MKPHLIVILRLIGFCFILFGSLMLLERAFSHFSAAIHERLLGPGQEPLDPFGVRDLIQMAGRGLPALVGMGLLWFSAPLARLILPRDEAPLTSLGIVSIRVVLLITSCFIACIFLEQCFDSFEMQFRYREESTGLSREFLLTAFSSLLPLVPVSVFWLTSCWMGRKIARLESDRNA